MIQSETEVPTAVDLIDLKTRADRATESLRQTQQSLIAQHALAEGAIPPNLEQTLEGLRERMLDALSLGFTDSVPHSARGSSVR